jgi:NADPH:quinone reductase-like Zn-dependent oxidoreductase
MKAIVYHSYGSPDVLKCAEIEKPTPGDNEVLIRVRAASVNPLDWHFMRGSPYLVRLMTGLRKPKVPRLGVDVAGQVEAVGGNVTQFKPGDAVFGGCRGAFAEYACAAERGVVMKPDNLTFEEAASVNIAAITALQALRDHGRIQSGQKVLINGAAGGRGHVCRADCQVVRRGCYGRMQYKECGHGPIDRREPGHRLHARGFH